MATDQEERLFAKLADVIDECEALRARVAELEQECARWKDSTGLVVGGDSQPVTPARLKAYLDYRHNQDVLILARVAELEAQLAGAREVLRSMRPADDEHGRVDNGERMVECGHSSLEWRGGGCQCGNDAIRARIDAVAASPSVARPEAAQRGEPVTLANLNQRIAEARSIAAEAAQRGGPVPVMAKCLVCDGSGRLRPSDHGLDVPCPTCRGRGRCPESPAPPPGPVPRKPSQGAQLCECVDSPCVHDEPLAAQPPDPKGEVCERCGKRGIVAPVTVVPIDGPVGRIDLLCRDCAEVPEPKGVPGPVAPGGGGAAEPLYQWVPRSDLDAANARILAANDECEYAIKLGREAAKERDAANERARIAEAALAGSYREDKDFAEAIWVEHQRIEAERDAALATIDRWKRNTQDSDSAIAKLTAERDLWKTTSDAHAMVLLTTEQERDAALASAAGMREALAKLWQYVNKHCGDWYMDAERRTIATLIEGPGGALSAAPSDYLARVRAEALRGALPKCNGRWSGGSGGHRQHEPCGATATWFDPPYWYCEEHVHDDEVEVYVMDWRDAIRALAPPSPTKEPSR